MLKPNDYRQTYVVARDLPYSAVQLETVNRPQHQGMLSTGRVVSLQMICETTESDVQVSAYAEGLGLVRINSRWLNRMR